MQNFGYFAPTKFQLSLINWSRDNDAKGGAKIVASIARRLTMRLKQPPYDLETFGVKMRLDPSRNIAEKRLVFSPNRFDFKEREILSETLVDGDVFVDIGANIGGYSMWAAKFVGSGKVIALEPQPKVFARLKTNADLNPEFNIIPLQIAAGADDSKMMMSISAANDGEASLQRLGQGGGFVEVDVKPLLDILRSQNITKVKAFKIDVEGFEESVLMPFFKTAPKSMFPQLIILERGDGDWETDLKQSLIGFGYKVAQTLRMNYVMELVK